MTAGVRGQALAAAFGFVLAGCADESPPPGSTCPGFCSDDDPCTTDGFCDTARGVCIFVPIDAANACRYDWHCDDGNDCTIDSCQAPEGCGALLRCRHEVDPTCRECGHDLDCGDGDPCSLDRCLDGFCRHEPAPLCERRCLADIAPQDGEFRAFGTLVLEDCACPCAFGLALASEESGVLALTTPGAGDCELSCGSPASCTPLVPDERWAVWGRLDGQTLAAEGWCLAPVQALPRRTLRGLVHLGAAGSAAIELQPDPFSSESATILFSDQVGEAVFVPSSGSPVSIVEGLGRRFEFLLATGFSGAVQPVEVIMFPGPTGYSGVVRSMFLDIGAEPVEGTITLRLEGL